MLDFHNKIEKTQRIVGKTQRLLYYDEVQVQYPNIWWNKNIYVSQ